MVKNDPLKSLSFPQSASGVAKNCLFYRMNARLISHAESVSDRLIPCFTPLSASLIELIKLLYWLHWWLYDIFDASLSLECWFSTKHLAFYNSNLLYNQIEAKDVSYGPNGETYRLILVSVLKGYVPELRVNIISVIIKIFMVRKNDLSRYWHFNIQKCKWEI